MVMKNMASLRAVGARMIIGTDAGEKSQAAFLDHCADGMCDLATD